MGNHKKTKTRRRTPPHSTTAFSQRCKAWPRPSTPASTSATWWIATIAPLIGGCSSTCPPCPHPIDVPRAQTVFLEEEDYWCAGRVTSSRTRFQNFQVEERMKVIKEIHEHFRKFFYQEENFNFSHFRRKLKFHIFSCLKFYFKIPKI